MSIFVLWIILHVVLLSTIAKGHRYIFLFIINKSKFIFKVHFKTSPEMIFLFELCDTLADSMWLWLAFVKGERLVCDHFENSTAGKTNVALTSTRWNLVVGLVNIPAGYLN